MCIHAQRCTRRGDNHIFDTYMLHPPNQYANQFEVTCRVVDGLQHSLWVMALLRIPCASWNVGVGYPKNPSVSCSTTRMVCCVSRAQHTHRSWKWKMLCCMSRMQPQSHHTYDCECVGKQGLWKQQPFVCCSTHQYVIYILHTIIHGRIYINNQQSFCVSQQRCHRFDC